MKNKLKVLSLKVLETLTKKSLTISTAESCTGGLIAQYITSNSGASNVFLGGFVTYSNKSKINLLEVNKNTLKNFGAVSKNTVLEMCQGTQAKLNSDISIAVSGVAGLNGGTQEKPVGLVHHGFLFKNNIYKHVKHIYEGNREEIRYKTVETCFKIILKEVNNF